MYMHNGHPYANVLGMSVRFEVLWEYGLVIWVLGFYFEEAINPFMLSIISLAKFGLNISLFASLYVCIMGHLRMEWLVCVCLSLAQQTIFFCPT